MISPRKALASVIVCTYRRDEPLRTTLRDLIAQNNGSYEILVVDQLADHDAETDSFLMAEQFKGTIRYFDCESAGLTFARNFGAKQAQADILVFCDDDVLLGKNWVAAHLTAYDDQNVAAVAGQVLHEGEKPGDVKGTFAYRQVLDNFTQIYGANFSIRKTVYDHVGGSDENLGVHAYTEDVILARRLGDNGFRIIYNPNASVIHLQAVRGGCRISDPSQPTDEWEKSYSKLYWFFLSPPRSIREYCARFWEAARHGPLRRNSVVQIWRQPSAWCGFFKALRKARRDASKQCNTRHQF